MPRFEVLQAEQQATAARETLRHFCETRQGAVKKMGFEPVGDSAVAKTSWGTVEWMFALRIDRETFHEVHGTAVVIKGGPTHD